MSESTPILSPPLQRFARFFHALGSGSKGRVTPEMQKYLEEDCASTSDVTRMKDYCDKNKITCPLSAESVAAVGKRAQTVQANATQQASAATQKAAELLQKVTSAIAINQRTYLIGITDDDTAGSDFTTVTWTLDSGSFLGPLRLRTLTSVATAVGAYLIQLRAMAQLKDASNLDKYAEASILAVKEAYKDPQHMHVVFGSLEIKRHAAVVGIGLSTYAKIADSEKTRIENMLHEAAQCIQTINNEIRELVDMHQSTNHMTVLRDSCCALLVEYSVFFNTTFAYMDFLKGQFGSFAASFLPYQSALYGVSRFPSVGQVILDRDDKPAPVQTARNPYSNAMYSFSTLRLTSENEWMYPTTTNTYEESLELTVANVVAPPQTFAVALILSALATKPLSDALCVASCVAEVQSLYFTSPDITALVQAASEGQWAKVLQLADTLLKKYVEGDVFVPASVVAKLSAQVKVVVCYHMFVVYDHVRLADVVKATGLPLGEVEKVAIQLIRSGVLQARINHVEGKLTRVIPSDAYSAEALLQKTLCETETAITHAETQLQLLSAQRHLVTASVYSVDPQYWARAPARTQELPDYDYPF